MSTALVDPANFVSILSRSMFLETYGTSLCVCLYDFVICMCSGSAFHHMIIIVNSRHVNVLLAS